jgi:hypothetical protein
VLTTIPPSRPDALSPPPETLLRTVTANRLQNYKFPPLEFFVEGLIAEGLTLLVGSPKVGKSWLALDMALAIASGRPALGQIPVSQCDVLFLALEDGPRRIQDRIRTLIGSDQPWPASLHVAVERPEGDVRIALDDHVEAWPRTRVVIVDTLAKTRPPARPGDAMYDGDYRFAGQLQRWAVDHRMALVALHHDRKMAAVDFVDAVSGSHGITGAADTIAVLTRARGDEEGLLQLTGRDIADDVAWRLKRSGPAWKFLDKQSTGMLAATVGLGDRAADVAGFVVSADKPVGAAEIVLSLGLDRDLVDRYLKRLRDSGRIIRVARGRYAAPSAAPLSEASEVSEATVVNLTHPTHQTPLFTDPEDPS